MGSVYEAFSFNDRNATGYVLADLTIDFCKTVDGTDVSQTGMTLTELGVGKYIIMNPNIDERTVCSGYVTATQSYSFSVVFDPADGDHARQSLFTDEAGTYTIGGTDASLVNICGEGLKKAGYSSGTAQYSTLLARATSTWAEEIKNDIFSIAKNPTYLQKTAVIPLTAKKARYTFPADFSTPISLTLLSSTTTGTAQAGAASTVTLASSDANDADYMEGREIVITGGTGANQIRQIISYDATTKIATVDQAWSTNPASGSTYMIAETYDKLTEDGVWNADFVDNIKSPGKPSRYYPEGEKASGQTTATYTGGFSLSSTPDGDQTYAIKLRYYMDLTKVELDTAVDPTIAVLYNRWRNVFIQGIFVKALQNMDDNRYAGEFSIYDRLLKSVQARETYGVDMNDMRMRVSD